MTYKQFKDQLCRSASEWNSFASDKTTVSYICSLVNCGIGVLNKNNQIKIKDQYKIRSN